MPRSAASAGQLSGPDGRCRAGRRRAGRASAIAGARTWAKVRGERQRRLAGAAGERDDGAVGRGWWPRARARPRGRPCRGRRPSRSSGTGSRRALEAARSGTAAHGDAAACAAAGPVQHDDARRAAVSSHAGDDGAAGGHEARTVASSTDPRRRENASSMSVDRQPITAESAPAAVGPYSHAVRSGGFLFCSGQIAAGPGDGRARRGRHRRADAPVPAQPRRRSARRPARRSRDAVRMRVYVTDMGAFAEVNEAYAEFFADRPARARRRSASRRCRSARRSRSTPIVALPAEAVTGRAGHRRGRRRAPATAIARRRAPHAGPAVGDAERALRAATSC